ncbi:hypothetical protein [Duganella hordei]|uniref:hypothetical protein n=2 Tax=Duganella TaxID=75654 RepID=UPI0030E8E39A
MSSTVTTTTTSTTYTTEDPSGFVGTLKLTGAPSNPEEVDIALHDPGNDKNYKQEVNNWLNSLPIPDSVKDMIRTNMGLTGGGNQPSESGAAKTINDFQKNNNIGLLSSSQMKQMADTGYLTGKDGKTVQVPPDVQAAAKVFMANDAAFFKKMESATNGKHDGQLGQGDYGNAVKDGTIQANGGSNGNNGPTGIPKDSFMSAVMNGHVSPNRPSEYGAAKTINDFQKEHNIGLLSDTQMKQMADTGYLTGKDGKTIQVPPEVQDAAKTYMANDAALFKKLESATDGKHDGQLGQGDFNHAVSDGSIAPNYGTNGTPTPGGQPPVTGSGNTGNTNLPSDSSAVNTIKNFQNDKNTGMLSDTQMKQMADTGYLTGKDGKTIQVPPEVQQAAKTYMANDGELFKKIESATNGQHDGLLATWDADAAVKDGSVSANGGPNGTPTPGGQPPVATTGSGNTNLPSDSSAVNTIKNFQNDKNTGMLSDTQMKQMADTGYLTGKDGKTIQVPPEVQQAAKTYMANDGELFKKIESATNGQHDGLLATWDADAAVKDGSVSANGGPGPTGTPTPGGQPPVTGTGNTNLPSDSSAVGTIKNFQNDKATGMLSDTQMKQMADTGYLTGKDGKTIQVPPEVQQAAKAYMANDAELFKKIESATNGQHDGLLATWDADAARKDGTVSA